ncbi:MAG TPA: M28 family peptidase [Gemmatimonadales bacterium]
MRGLLLLLAAGGVPASIAAQRPGDGVARAVRADVVRGHMEFLASDALEGRGTGTRGGEIAAKYVAAQFERLGLEPAGDSGTWFQRVPLTGRRFTSSLGVAGGPALTVGTDFVAYLPGSADSAQVTADVAFVGYGIVAPEEGWDDYRGVDVTGKIVLMIVGTPGDQDTTLFRHPARPDYGFRQYKVEEAARHGAVGAFVVYRQPYQASWPMIADAWLGEQLVLGDQGAGESATRVAGWINEAAARSLVTSAGEDLDRLAAAAARPGAPAVPLKLTLAAAAQGRTRIVPTVNVVGRLRGRTRAAEAVLLGAHYDHLGIGRAIAGDSIYNGALDNASGTAGMLAIAEAFVTAGARPDRSVLFVAFGAEEAGLLGSAAFVARPPLPLAQLSAMLNLDGLNVLADTRDISALGADLSSLGDVFRAAATAEGYAITDRNGPILQEAVQQGFFSRSDQASFARAGVPVAFLFFGDRVGTGPVGSGKERLDDYLEHRYHQPNDDLHQSLDYEAAAHYLRVFARTLLATANAPQPALWNKDSPYQRSH